MRSKHNSGLQNAFHAITTESYYGHRQISHPMMLYDFNRIDVRQAF